jgi:RNA polymerase sigma-70 factor, ECF subfamily
VKEPTVHFEEHRDHLVAVAYRMLGSRGEAEDAVQETWLRLHRADTTEVSNLGGWLTTVLSRVCLDMLRARRSRREEPIGARLPEPPAGELGPEQEAELGDSIGLALLVVLDTLAPAERLAFVLHDMFGVSFEEIAPIVGRSVPAARQLASRGRRKVRGGAPTPPRVGENPTASRDAPPGESGNPTRETATVSLARQRAVVDAFLAASRKGDFDALLELLDPDVVLRADEQAVRTAAANADQGAPRFAPRLRGASAVAQSFLGRAQGARPALVNGAVGAAYAPGGRPFAVFEIVTVDGRITEISVTADPEYRSHQEITVLD